MNKLSYVAVLVLAVSCTPKYSDVIIPQPQQVQVLEGCCPRDAATAVVIDTTMASGPESYELNITATGIEIKAGGEAGAFYARQSLEQIRSSYRGKLPCVKITDWPRFKYRGCHIDASRHFWDKEVIKKQLEMFARLKLNRLHMHLTDGAGWRVQIDSYPLLTQKAAFRNEENLFEWNKGVHRYGVDSSDGTYGGFYSKDDIREIVSFADSLHITVVPEIEMFGHSDEVTAVYPELGCLKKEGYCNDLCIGDERTFEFLETVLDEVMELFPSEYIHIGGDEAAKWRWKQCPMCQERIRKEHLDGVDGLQSYGVHRIDEYVRSRGRKIIGWDEILEGGLAPGAVVMSWRGEDGGKEAAAAGHEVVMTPSHYCYLDFVQSNPLKEPLGFGGVVTLPFLYSYDPAPEDMPGREWVAGVQTNLWTERVKDPWHLEYMLYPRVFALSEVAWSNPCVKDYDRFYDRVIAFSEKAREMGYTVFDQRTADLAPAGYDDVHEHLALGCKVEYLTRFSDNAAYEGGANALTDGRIGGYAFYDRWQSYKGHDASVVVDLGRETQVREVSTQFLQFWCVGYMLPQRVIIELSSDGENYNTVYDEPIELDWDKKGYEYRTLGWQSDRPVQARYIKVTARINDRKWGKIALDEVFVN